MMGCWNWVFILLMSVIIFETDSALDEEAFERATSVYLPDRVVPMLPEKISNELCSLRPHEDKLTYSCVFKMTSKGEIKDVWIGRTVIHSNHRFTYEDVQKIIETNTGLYDKEVLLLNELAKSMRKKRMKEGAINFSSQEVRFKLDEMGRPIGIVIKESKESHQLIEEFMLLANRTIAEKVANVKVSNKPLPFPYRIHDQPDDDRLIPFVEFAKKYGYHFLTTTPELIAKSFNEMLNQGQGIARTTSVRTNGHSIPWPRPSIPPRILAIMASDLSTTVILHRLSEGILMCWCTGYSPMC